MSNTTTIDLRVSSVESRETVPIKQLFGGRGGRAELCKLLDSLRDRIHADGNPFGAVAALLAWERTGGEKDTDSGEFSLRLAQDATTHIPSSVGAVRFLLEVAGTVVRLRATVTIRGEETTFESITEPVARERLRRLRNRVVNHLPGLMMQDRVKAWLQQGKLSLSQMRAGARVQVRQEERVRENVRYQVRERERVQQRFDRIRYRN